MADNPDAVVITGASSGIGAAMARVYAERGASLVLVARRTDRLEALKDETAGKAGRVETVTLDLETPDAPEALMSEIERRGLTVHTLVNNAGFGLRGRFTTMPYDEQVAMVQLNVVALTRLCRLAAPAMMERRAGGIINVASTAAFQAVPYLGVYAATKSFVLSLSEAMHEEMKRHGVVVTALCPGPTATEFASRADLEKSKMFESSMPARIVAELGIAGHEAGKAVVVTGARNLVGTLVVRAVPRSLVRWAAGRLQG